MKAGGEHEVPFEQGARGAEFVQGFVLGHRELQASAGVWQGSRRLTRTCDRPIGRPLTGLDQVQNLERS
jgi:hypothetical protein